tara:strand:+ start:13286 stop:13645 length:360 start_codon:yes stop_codon:yes gene_type:complete
MLLKIVIIYVIIILIIEAIFIFLNYKKDKYISFKNIDTSNEELKNNNELIYKETDNDLDIKNYTGRFAILNYNGFFIHEDKWFIIEEKKEYDFKYPVNIKIIKLNDEKKIEYYSEVKIN